MNESIASLYRHSTAAGPPLRVCVAVDDWYLPIVYREVLRDICECDFAELCCVLHVATPTAAPDAPRTAAVAARARLEASGRDAGLFALYRRWINARFPTADDPLRPADCRDLLGSLPAVSLVEQRPESAEISTRQPLEALRGERIDVVLKMTSSSLARAVFDVPRYGVWAYDYGDREPGVAGAAGFWEMYGQSPVTRIELQRIAAGGGEHTTLVAAQFTTESTVSMALNAHVLLWGSRHFVIQKLNEIHSRGDRAAGPRQASARAPAVRGGRRRAPNNLEMVAWAARRVAPKLIRRAFGPRSLDTWRVALRKSDEPLFVGRAATGGTPFKLLENPRGHYWADPFLIDVGNQVYLLMEDLPFATRKGVIIAAAVAPDGTLGPVETVLERPYHLSYPFVFAHGGDVFMIPETYQAGVIELYRARRFPHDWVREQTLLSVPGLDSTPFQAHGRWWMFTSPIIGEAHPAVNMLFTATALDGEWRLHPASPIATDVRWARNGGAVVQEGGRLVRVSQNCAGGYGRSLGFSTITRLSEFDYEERPDFSLEPGWMPGQIGVHTYNRAAGWEVIDAKFNLPAREVLGP